jgi:hypothetical protein
MVLSSNRRGFIGSALSPKWTAVLGALCILLLAIGTASAIADAPVSGLPPGAIQGSTSALEALKPRLTDPQAAAELPRHELDRNEAIELMRSVFRPELQSPAGIFDDLHVEKFLSDNVAVIGVGEQPAPAGVALEGEVAQDQHEGPTLVDSTVSLRTEGPSGHQEEVDLGLEHTEGEIQPSAPLVEVGIPSELGEGIELPESGIRIEAVGAPAERSPSTVEQSVAVYPEIAEDTSLAVAPTPIGLETMTLLQSPQAPRSETFHLDLPDGASLRVNSKGGAEVILGTQTLLSILPPIALDANGKEVPVSLDVTGSSLGLSVSPEDSTTWPVLVDPVYDTHSWYPNNSTGLSDWVSATNTSHYAATNHPTCGSLCPSPLNSSMPGCKVWLGVVG